MPNVRWRNVDNFLIGYKPSERFLNELKVVFERESPDEYTYETIEKVAIDLIHAFTAVL